MLNGYEGGTKAEAVVTAAAIVQAQPAAAAAAPREDPPTVLIVVLCDFALRTLHFAQFGLKCDVS
jgi:hypothetical protein